MKDTGGNRIIAFTLLLIAVCSAALDYYLPQMGDDLKFWTLLGLDSYTFPDITTLKFIVTHILGVNGRIFDYIGPVVINLLPRIPAAILMGGMTGLYFYSMRLMISTPEEGRYTSFLLAYFAIILAVMPWWDSLWLRVCQFNYSWATTFCLLFIYLFFASEKFIGNNPKGLSSVLLFMLGIFAGGSHEQTGVAMCFAFMLWALRKMHSHDFSKREKIMGAGLITGTLMPLITPAFWHRVGSGTLRDDTIHLAATTLPVYIGLLVLLAGMTLTKKGRKYLFHFFYSENTILIISASVAAAIALFSGIPGRTGWYTESASLIIIARMIVGRHIQTNRYIACVFGTIAFLFIGMHYLSSIRAQRNAYMEFENVKSLYQTSTDGIVYYDCIRRYDYPALTLYRIKGAPDADDWWLNHVMTESYGDDRYPLVILPTSFRDMMPLTTDSLTIGNTTIYRQMPTDTIMSRDGLTFQNRETRQRIVIQLPQGWVATEFDVDPGDYH